MSECVGVEVSLLLTCAGDRGPTAGRSSLGGGQGLSSRHPCLPRAGAFSGWSSWGRGLSLPHSCLPCARARGGLILAARRSGAPSGAARGEGAPGGVVCGEGASVGTACEEGARAVRGEGIRGGRGVTVAVLSVSEENLCIKEKRMVRD
jgi:hypothetical protein